MSDATVAAGPDVPAVIARWKASAAAERANYQRFLTELCAVIGVPQPEPTRPDSERMLAQGCKCATGGRSGRGPGGKGQEAGARHARSVFNPDWRVWETYDRPSAAESVHDISPSNPGTRWLHLLAACRRHGKVESTSVHVLSCSRVVDLFTLRFERDFQQWFSRPVGQANCFRCVVVSWSRPCAEVAVLR